MKDFGAGPSRLRVLPAGAKVLYCAFIVATLAGLLVSWKLYGAVVGDEGSSAYYAGKPVTGPAPPSTPAPGPSGPVLELPQEAAPPKVIIEQISDRKLLEVTHFHLFSIPVYVLILAHLWLLARLPSWLHTTGILAAVITSGLHLAAPWLVRSSASLAWLIPASGIAMLASLAAIGVVAAVDMWMPSGKEPGVRRARRRPQRAS